ncbi:MAG: hypothetical protein H0X71_11495 [Rubrobacter sp.]|nr:hypothetical protein [Rubrobacter sp.]
MQSIGQTELLIGAAVLVVLVVLVVIFLISRRGRTHRMQQQRERTREEFGQEYDRLAEERGSEEEAEKELRQRRGRVGRQVKSLSDDSRQRYEEQWGEVERVFVDNPERSIEMADRTVSDLLQERNFIADAAQDDRETEKGLAAMYPEVAGDYREARRARADVVARSARSSDSGDDPDDEPSEDLLQAVRKYRTVYERLVRD